MKEARGAEGQSKSHNLAEKNKNTSVTIKSEKYRSHFIHPFLYSK